MLGRPFLFLIIYPGRNSVTLQARDRFYFMAKISLCLIVGNVEEYIVRCLDSFAPVADEIVCVRAIGNQTPDRTLELAREKFGAITAEYQNAPAHADWPHVDDFAAARNMSFDLATGDYCLWVDTDDILLQGAEFIRGHAEKGEFDTYVFPYHIFGRGLMVPRDRLTRRGAGRWVYPLHEAYDFTRKPAHAAQDDRVVIQHLPHDTKTGSHERNLRILRSIPDDQLNTSLLYHYHVELLIAKDDAGALALAQRALAQPDIGKAEKHEIFMNLARLAQQSEDWELERALLHQAYAADPIRREGLALLCNNAMNTHQAEAALAYARQMIATPRPKNAEWNDRAPLYSWVGDDLYSQALRMSGRIAEAEAARQNLWAREGGPRISLVHATRGRLIKAAAARKLWLDRADKPWLVEHIFCIDDDDAEVKPLKRFHHLSVPAGGGCVRAFNHGVWATVADVIVIMADDVIPPQKWDQLILERLGPVREPKVLGVSDGYQTGGLLTCQIFTRAWLQLDGHVYHPLFKNVFADQWFTHCAYARNLVIEARDLIFEHDHPLKTGAPFDATYAAQNSNTAYAYGHAVFQKLLAANLLAVDNDEIVASERALKAAMP